MKVYVIIDKDDELVAVAKNIDSIKEAILNEFNNEVSEIRIEETNAGYQIKVKDQGFKFKYNAYHMQVVGGN